MHLAEKAGLWTEDRQTAAREVERRILAGELTVVRLSFADQHGLLRGKTLVSGEIAGAIKSGVGFTTTMLLKDTAHRTVFPVWQPGGGFGMKELEGAADVMMLPDPTTFRVLPWRRIPAGCCATSSSPTAGRCRSARAMSIARRCRR